MSLIDDVLAKASPQQKQRVRDRMMMAARIDDALQAKGWSQKELAEKMSKQPSEISKWLSGTHNFTLDTLSHLSVVLDVQLLCTKDIEPKVVTRVVTKYQTVFVTASGNDVAPVSFAKFQSGIAQSSMPQLNA